jgi:hypothetical protein
MAPGYSTMWLGEELIPYYCSFEAANLADRFGST